MVPADGSSRKLMQRSSVLLPEPLRPMMQTTSRGITSRHMSLRTCSMLNHLCSPSTWTTGSALIGFPHASLDPTLDPGRDYGKDPIRGGRDEEHFHVFAVAAGVPVRQERDLPHSHDGD